MRRLVPNLKRANTIHVRSWQDVMRLGIHQESARNQSNSLAQGVLTDWSGEWHVRWNFTDTQLLLVFCHASGRNAKHAVPYSQILDLQLENNERHRCLIVVYTLPTDSTHNEAPVLACLIPWQQEMLKQANAVLNTWRTVRNADKTGRALKTDGVLWRGKCEVNDAILVWLITKSEIVFCYSNSVLTTIPLCHIGDLAHLPEERTMCIQYMTYQSTRCGPATFVEANSEEPVVRLEIKLPEFGGENDFSEFALLWRQQMQLKSIEDALCTDSNETRLYRAAVDLRDSYLASRALWNMSLDEELSSELLASRLERIEVGRSLENSPPAKERATESVADDVKKAPSVKMDKFRLQRADSMRRFLTRSVAKLPSRSRTSTGRSSLAVSLTAATPLQDTSPTPSLSPTKEDDCSVLLLNNSSSNDSTPDSFHSLPALSEHGEEEEDLFKDCEPVDSFTAPPATANTVTTANTANISKDTQTSSGGIRQRSVSDSPVVSSASQSPISPPPTDVIITKYQALYDYTPTGQGEMEMKAGQIVQVLKQDDSGWWYAVTTANNTPTRKGWIPSNYVEIVL